MAYPTGSGTEILYRGTIHAQSNTGTSFRWDKTNPTTGTSSYTVPANHIITVLSVTFCEVGGAAESFHFDMHDGTNYIYFLNTQSIGIRETFVWSDKIVLVGGDKMSVNLTSAGNMDVTYTFIDQDWS